MKKSLFLFSFFIFHVSSFAQIVFEEGYLINNSGEKISCLIKNNDWKHNPSSFEYKTSQNAVIKKAIVEQVQEFGVISDSKYIRFKVKIDKSSDNLNQLSHSKQPEYEEELLFLRCLIDGKANLYSYEVPGLERYFYSLEGDTPKQLIFKRYLTKSEQVKKNNHYQQQLWNSLKCSTLFRDKVANISYNKKQLIDFFVAYNQCQNASYTNYKKKSSKKSFKLTVRPGLMITTLAIYNEMSQNRDWDFGSKLNYRIGLETEFVLPFNKNKWSIIIEPTYHTYTTNDESDFEKVDVRYNSIEIPIGIRHYFFLDNDSKLFLNGALVLELPLKSIIDYEFSRDLDLGSSGKGVFGIGYNIQDKYSVELRLGIANSVLNKYLLWGTDYRRATLILGYNLW